MAGADVAHAAPDRDPAWQAYHHTVWAVADGVPAGISGLAQTADGYLWLGAATGLFHFDGVRFERFTPPEGQALRSRNISTLAALPSGALWIGHRFGGASRWQNGQLTNYGLEQGLPTGTLLAFTQDKQGRAWASSSHGVAVFDGQRWQVVGLGDAATGPDEQAVYALVTDASGAIWASAEQGVYVLRPGETRFARASDQGGFAWMVPGPDGQVWASQGAPGLRPWSLNALGRDGTESPGFRLGGETGALGFDRENNLWVGSARGVLRLPASDWQQRGSASRAASGEPPAFSRQHGLSGDIVLAMLEDREGTIWLSTNGGLDRFRRHKLNRAPLPPQSLWYAITPGDGETIWVGSANQSLIGVHAGEPLTVEQRPAVGGRITSAFRDRQGRVWMAGAEGVWRSAGNQFEKVPVPEAIAGSPVQAMTQTREGDILIAAARKGIYRLSGTQWSAEPSVPGTPQPNPMAMATDAQGRLWSAFPDNLVTLADGERRTYFGTAQGLQVGNALALLVTDTRVWVAGEMGLAHFDGQRFQALQSAEREDLQGLSGVVQASDGSLWTNGAAGVVRIAPQEVQAALADPRHHVRVERFDFRDGLEGAAVQLRPVPSAVVGNDGKLWFATNNGVVWIDPLRIPRNTLAPPVVIESLVAEGRAAALHPALELPVGTRSLAIRYTALSLAIPERVRFRYRLEGVDSTWQEAGPRREAFYTNLGPGAYRFRVLAANDDGVWNETGASLSFTVLPAIYQTWWFRLMCVPLVAGLLWALYQVRLRAVAERLSDRLQARLIERERIARELHDTLLQSVQGLILRFQSGAARLAADDPVRAHLAKALDRAEQVLEEGRDRVNDLRLPTTGERDLADDFQRLAEELTESAGDAVDSMLPPGSAEAPDGEWPVFTLQQRGALRPLRPGVHEELYLIGREALVNAFRHARAQHVVLQLGWGHDALRLVVTDDGRGISPEVFAAGGRPGHWGLAGMRERAADLSAALSLRSEPGAGTTMSLRLPAALAYAGPPALASRWLHWLTPWRHGA